tara:strand:+ start:4894 stop:6255 length:1362 start_codon:yes stop_codon:yes gene_type:complete
MSDWSSFKDDKKLVDAWRRFLTEEEENISSNDIVAEVNWVQGLKGAGNVVKKIGGVALDIAILPVRAAFAIDHMSPQRFASAIGLRDTVSTSTPSGYSKGGREAAERNRLVKAEMREAAIEYKRQQALQKEIEKQQKDAPPDLQAMFEAITTELGQASQEINNNSISESNRNLSDRLRSMVDRYEDAQNQRAAKGVDEAKVEKIDELLKQKLQALVEKIETLNLDENAKKKALAKAQKYIKTNRLMMLSQVKHASLQKAASDKIAQHDAASKEQEEAEENGQQEPEENGQQEPEQTDQQEPQTPAASWSVDPRDDKLRDIWKRYAELYSRTDVAQYKEGVKEWVDWIGKFLPRDFDKLDAGDKFNKFKELLDDTQMDLNKPETDAFKALHRAMEQQSGHGYDQGELNAIKLTQFLDAIKPVQPTTDSNVQEQKSLSLEQLIKEELLRVLNEKK